MAESIDASDCQPLLCYPRFPTFWFHHQPSNVPCIIHVSAPKSAMVDRYVCMRAVKCGKLSVSGKVSEAKLEGKSASSLVRSLFCIYAPAIVVRMESG